MKLCLPSRHDQKDVGGDIHGMMRVALREKTRKEGSGRSSPNQLLLELVDVDDRVDRVRATSTLRPVGAVILGLSDVLGVAGAEGLSA